MSEFESYFRQTCLFASEGRRAAADCVSDSFRSQRRGQIRSLAKLSTSPRSQTFKWPYKSDLTLARQRVSPN